MVLIFTVAMLALVATLGMMFVTTAAVERSLGGTFAAQARAQLAAESGVDAAVACLGGLSGGTLTAEELERLGYFDSERLAFANTIVVGGQSLRVSGLLQDSAAALVAYRVTISDLSGRLNLNDSNAPCPVPADHPAAGRGRMAVIFGALCDALGTGVSGASAADALFQARAALPGDRFPDWQAVHTILATAGMTVSEIARLRRECALHGWRDATVLRHAPPLEPGTDVDRWLEFQTAVFATEPRSPVNLNTASPELLTALIQPLEGVFLEEGPAECQSMEHYGWWSTGMGPVDSNAGRWGTVRATKAFTGDQARLLAEAIHDRVHGRPNDDVQAHVDGDTAPNPLETWEELRDFLESGLTPAAAVAIFVGGGFGVADDKDAPLPPPFFDPHAADDPANPGNGYFTQGFAYAGYDTSWYQPGTQFAMDWWNRYYAQFQKDLIYANFNPNSLLNDWNPDRNTYLGVDKAQIRVPTAEGCLAPAGFFEVESEGRLYDNTGRVQANQAVRVTLRAWQPLRITSQAQFMAGVSQRSDIAARFSAAPPREPGWTQPACYTGTQTLTLQSYPEPMLWVDPMSLKTPPSPYDGQLKLATLSTDPTYTFMIAEFDGVRYNGGATTQCQDALILNRGYNGLTPPLVNHADAFNRPHSGPLTGQLDPVFDTPGNVYPDGAYSESGRVIAYSLANFKFGALPAGVSGSIAFWLKPNFHPGISTRIRQFLAAPSRGGYYARQTLCALMYLSNPGGRKDVVYPMPLGTFGIRPFYGQSSRNAWIPPRCLALGSAWQHTAEWSANMTAMAPSFQRGMTVSYTVNHDSPLSSQTQSSPTDDTGNSVPLYHMDGHEWTALSVAWQLAGQGSLGINSRVPSLCWGKTQTGFESFYGNWDGLSNDDFGQSWLRFGNLPASSTPGESAAPYAADSTLDGVIGGQGSGGVFEVPFRQGRYLYRTSADANGEPYVAWFASPAFDLFQELSSDSRRLTLRSAAWTLYRPRHNHVYDPDTIYNPPGEIHSLDDTPADNVRGIAVNPNDREDPMSVTWAASTSISPDVKRTWDPLSVDVRRADGLWFYDQFVAMGKKRRMTYPGGSVIDPAQGPAPVYERGDSFQFRAYFHLDSAKSPGGGNQRLYESPVLDDLTFVFAPESPQILEWTVER